MAQRRDKAINAKLSPSSKEGDETISGDWTFTGTVDLTGTVDFTGSVDFNTTDAVQFFNDIHASSGSEVRVYAPDAGSYLQILTDASDISYISGVSSNLQLYDGAGRTSFDLGDINDGNIAVMSGGFQATSNPGGGNYHSGLHFRHRLSGDYATQLLTASSSARPLLFVRQKVAGSYGSWYEAAFSDYAESITAQWTFTEGSNPLTLKSNAPKLKWYEEDAPTDEAIWDIVTAAGQLRFRALNTAESTQNNWFTVDRNGANAQTIALTPYGNLQFSSSTGHVQLLNDMDLIVYDSTNTHYLRAHSSAFSGQIYTNNKPIKIYAGISSTSQFTIENSLSLADDASGQFSNNGQAYGIWIVVNSYDSSTMGIIACAGTNALKLAGGSNMSVGTSGTNPDVDTDFNFWTDSAGNLHVKNRMGSTRRITAYNFSG